MSNHKLEEAIIDMGILLAEENESLDMFEDETLDMLASCLLCEIELRKKRVLNWEEYLENPDLKK